MFTLKVAGNRRETTRWSWHSFECPVPIVSIVPIAPIEFRSLGTVGTVGTLGTSGIGPPASVAA